MIDLRLDLVQRVALQFGEALQPFGEREHAHLIAVHLPGDHQHHRILDVNVDVVAEQLDAFGADHVSILFGCWSRWGVGGESVEMMEMMEMVESVERRFGMSGLVLKRVDRDAQKP